MSGPGDLGPIDRLVELAETLAGAWGARARLCTTVGQERALLRMFGVTGLDARVGRSPAEVVDRYVGGRPRRARRRRRPAVRRRPARIRARRRRSSPSTWPRAPSTWGSRPRSCATRSRRAVVEVEARALGRSALERIDANRTARLELLAVHRRRRQAVDRGTARGDRVSATAIEEAVGPGDGRRRRDPGQRAGHPRARRPAPRRGRRRPVLAAATGRRRCRVGRPSPPPSRRRPAASVRSPSCAASRRGRPPSDGPMPAWRPSAPALARTGEAPSSRRSSGSTSMASDAMAEIVDGNGRARSGAGRPRLRPPVLARSGRHGILVGAGPLVVAPDLARGVPSDATTRAGRALALQIVGVMLARLHGVPAGQHPRRRRCRTG